MKLLKYLTLILTINLAGAVTLKKDFNPNEGIQAVEMNNNFNLIDNHLSNLGTTIPFIEMNQGELIKKDDLLNNFNSVVNLNGGETPPSLSDEIKSSEINNLFLDLENFILNKLSQKEVQNISLSGTPSEGSYNLNYQTSSTTINYDDSLSQIETKLRSITSDNNLTLSGTTEDYAINFSQFGNFDNITVSSNSLKFIDGIPQRDPVSGSYFQEDPPVLYTWRETTTGHLYIYFNGNNIANGVSLSNSYSYGGWTYFKGDYVRDQDQGFGITSYFYKVYRVENIGTIISVNQILVQDGD